MTPGSGDYSAHVVAKMAGFSFLCVLLLCCCSGTWAGGSSSQLRGVSPQRLSFYPPDEDFTCLDGSNRIPFDMVNDDYCDCVDGSDEPGTSACANGKFFCENEGFRGSDIASSRVNDGICDCCDGSDEYLARSGVVGRACENTCKELGEKFYREAEEIRLQQEAGYQKRQQYSNQGMETNREKEQLLAQASADLNVLEVELETLKEAKEAAEQPEQEAKQKIEQMQNETREKAMSERRQENAMNMFKEMDKNQDELVTMDEVQQYTDLDIDGDGNVAEDEVVQAVGEWADMTFADFQEKGYDAVVDKIDFGEKVPSIDDSDMDYTTEYDDETNQLIEAANKARDEYSQAEDRKRKLTQEMDDAKKYLEGDFGLQKEFAPLHGQCYEYTDREYVYKFCPFDKVSQKSKSGGRETSLGRWGNWNGGSEDLYSRMKYGNGEQCWNGPTRSVQVILKCSAEESITSVSEPNRCEYELEFGTAAACNRVDPLAHLAHEEL